MSLKLKDGRIKGGRHRFWRDMFDEGVWFQARGNFMISAAHTEEDIKKTLESARKVLKQYANAQ